jgi:hypothetical protein
MPDTSILRDGEDAFRGIDRRNVGPTGPNFCRVSNRRRSVQPEWVESTPRREHVGERRVGAASVPAGDIRALLTEPASVGD